MAHMFLFLYYTIKKVLFLNILVLSGELYCMLPSLYHTIIMTEAESDLYNLIYMQKC